MRGGDDRDEEVDWAVGDVADGDGSNSKSPRSRRTRAAAVAAA